MCPRSAYKCWMKVWEINSFRVRVLAPKRLYDLQYAICITLATISKRTPIRGSISIHLPSSPQVSRWLHYTCIITPHKMKCSFKAPGERRDDVGDNHLKQPTLTIFFCRPKREPNYGRLWLCIQISYYVSILFMLSGSTLPKTAVHSLEFRTESKHSSGGYSDIAQNLVTISFFIYIFHFLVCMLTFALSMFGMADRSCTVTESPQ